MRYFVKNTFENLALIRTISDSFSTTNTHALFETFKQHRSIVLFTGENSTPMFRFRTVSEKLLISEAELREIVFTLSLEQ